MSSDFSCGTRLKRNFISVDQDLTNFFRNLENILKCIKYFYATKFK